MVTIASTRGNAQASEIAVQDAEAFIGSSSREDAQTVIDTIDADLARLYEDRNILLTQGGQIQFTGTTVTFTEALKLEINSQTGGGSPTIVDLGSTTRTVSTDGYMIYAVVDRSLGTATITDDSATLPAVVAANKEVILIAKRVDDDGGTKKLYWRNGQVFAEGDQREFSAIGLTNPMDSTGDLIIGGTGGAANKLDSGGAKTILHNATANTPSWSSTPTLDSVTTEESMFTKIEPGVDITVPTGYSMITGTFVVSTGTTVTVNSGAVMGVLSDLALDGDLVVDGDVYIY